MVTDARHRVDTLRRCIHALDAQRVLIFMNYQQRLKVLTQGSGATESCFYFAVPVVGMALGMHLLQGQYCSTHCMKTPSGLPCQDHAAVSASARLAAAEQRSYCSI